MGSTTKTKRKEGSIDNKKENETQEVEKDVEESCICGDDNNEDVEEAKNTLKVYEDGDTFFNEDEDVVLATLRRKKKNKGKCHYKKVQKDKGGIKLSTRLIMSDMVLLETCSVSRN
ncbi:hypothetical protein PIB30_020165 [Stylosanthes scabra]|uniref:Uncharacterized protein n=1 Tax=Stylosanthes scabra TaxID=79078 RepID=A0ABU6Z624_9FABA|nr:hypothetical protein [Stylosanthes scabra]